MRFSKGDKVTLAEAMKKSVRDPRRYRIGTVASVSSGGVVEVFWGKKSYAVCMRENELTSLKDEPQMTLF